MIGICLLFSVSILTFYSIYNLTIPVKDTPPANKGVLDLSGWDFRSKGLVSLDGQWEFYEGQLLTPADFRGGSPLDMTYITVPGTWKGKDGAGGMSRKGYGTYRLKVVVSNMDDIYGIKMRNIRMSHLLFINGKIEGASGAPAGSLEQHQPGNTPYSTYFHTDKREVEIIIQVANYMYITGGIINSIQFGLHSDISMLSGIQLGTDIGAVIILVILGIYHLNFYFLRMKEKAYLVSGLYLLTIMVGQLIYGEKVLLRFLPMIPFEIAYKLQDLSVYLSAIEMLLLFYFMDRRLMSVKRVKQVIAPLAIYIVGIIVLPYPVHSEYEYLFLIYIEILFLYIIARTIYLLNLDRQKDPSKRKEVLLFVSASGALLIFLTDGILYSENIVPTDLVGKMCFIAFITLYNILLAVRFTTAFEKTETLSQQLALSNQLKDEFLTNTSHEMKTPLHGILNITAHLLDDEENTLTAKQKQNLWLVKDTSVKLSMLIHDLIDVTRLKHGELRLNLTVVDVRVVTQFVFDVLQFELLGKDVRLDNLVEPDVCVYADENRLRQIMYNLVQNAIKHTEEGFIQVRSSVMEAGVTIYVEDTGTGIASNSHQTIFEYFEQVEAPLPQDGYTGMGVGLFISRKLVEKMGGEIRVDWSEVGQGTRIMFVLPKANVTEASREIAAADMVRRRVFHPDIDKPLDLLREYDQTIMIVDDEASNIHTLLQMLKKHKYNVITAFSAKEAMNKLKQYPKVDLVILDVMMPGVSGIELCRMLRSHYSIIELPILFATVKDTPDDIALGYRAGANDYVTKPFDSETLMARIQTLLAMKTSIREAIRNEQAFLQAQIKPHFLYNALSSVVSFCYTDGEKAAHLLSMLSQYLRYILDMDRSRPFVPLYREMELIEAYVEIEKARFGERLQYVEYVDESIQHIEIPSLCIQPFVENAIRHGLFEKEDRGTVTLIIREGDGYIQVVVEDDGVGMPDDLLYQMTQGVQKSGSIGIQNIRKRFESIPGAVFTIDSELGQGTKVTMFIPINKEGTKAVITEGRDTFV
ncbi:hybrid sensor histidine kinase/response regulator [Brevibacillus reuszeri]|uniref:hybrid sensor histidine kinase/response regulator n=1 Tax=Brevibacillus reuszeri TaxID=54915 RepID=UPI000CCC7760|nr:ATP-binding protein [Brevibacillus reuszeri]